MSTSEYPRSGLWKFLESMEPGWITMTGPVFPIDIRERADAYVVRADLPGVDPQQVQIQVQDDTLRISGEIPAEKPGEPGEWLLRERPSGAFTRTVILPGRVASGQVEAEYRNGMLIVELPKTPRGREIPIRTMQAGQAPTAAGAAGTALPSSASGTTERQPGQAAGTMAHPELRSGLAVLGSDGSQVGTVKQVWTNDLLVDRAFRRDIYVPVSAVQTVRKDEVVLNIPADQVDSQSWAQPGLT